MKTTLREKAESGRATAQRMTISLPPDLAAGLDAFVAEREFDSRSQAVAWMVREKLIDGRREDEHAIMAGTVTLFFRQTRAGLLEELARLKRQWVNEVIGSLQVQLERDHLMEVLLVQGPVRRLRSFTDHLLACKGVQAGHLTLTSEIIPPLHPLPEE